MKISDLQQFTELPLRIVQVDAKMLPDVLVNTPHKGTVRVALREEHYPFLFGSVSQTEKHADEVIREIARLEREAREYLFDEWLRGEARREV